VWNNLGNVYLDRGDLDQAVRHYTRAIELLPKAAAAYTNRARAYFRMGRYPEAIRDCTESIALRPDEPTVYFTRATALYWLQEYSAAWLTFARASGTGVNRTPIRAGSHRKIAVPGHRPEHNPIGMRPGSAGVLFHHLFRGRDEFLDVVDADLERGLFVRRQRNFQDLFDATRPQHGWHADEVSADAILLVAVGRDRQDAFLVLDDRLGHLNGGGRGA